MTELDEIDEMAGTTKGDQEMTDGKCPRCGASLHFNDEIGMFCPACAQQKDAMQAAWEATRKEAKRNGSDAPKCSVCGKMMARNALSGYLCCWTTGCEKFGVHVDANEAAKQRRASDIALAATEAERVARALRGEQMPPPFAVCEGHEKRIAALEAKADWEEDATDEWARGINGRLARLESYANGLEAAFGALADGTPVDEARAAFEHVNKRDRDVLAALNDEPTPCHAVTRVEVRDHFGRCLFFAAPANDVDLRYSDDGKTLTVVLRR